MPITPNQTPTQTRRAFLGTSAMAVAATPAILSRPAHADAHAAGRDDFTYEVQRTEEEWRALLSEEEYFILRENGTERRFTSDLATSDDPGSYHCRGCDLTLYESDWKQVLPIGWVFFYHAQPNAVLTGIDEWPAQAYGDSGMAEARFVIEAHCRRCGSHLGHILLVGEDVLHCINGTALAFRPETA